MADREKKDDGMDVGRRKDGDDTVESKHGKDVMRGRSFAGTNWANTERGQTNERERVAEHGANLDEAGELVTDAEIEAREENED
jgi:hypothetical protein